MYSIKPDVFKIKRLFSSKNYSKAYSVVNSTLSSFSLSKEASTSERKYVYADILRWKGIVEIKLGMYGRAIDTLEEVTKTLGSAPHEVIYYQSLARYYFSYFVFNKKSVLVPALWDLKAVYGNVSQELSFKTLLALVHVELDELYDAELLINGGSMKTRRAGIRMYLKKGDLKTKIAEAHIYLKRGDLSKACHTIDELLKYEKENVDALLEKSLLLTAKGQFKDSIDLLDTVLKLENTNSLAMLFKAQNLEYLKREKEALSIYKKLDGILDSPVVKSRIAGLTQYNPPIPLSPPNNALPPNPPPSPSGHTPPSPPPKPKPSNPISTNTSPTGIASSRLLNPTAGNLTWDPKVWIGKRFSIYHVESFLGEGGNGYVLRAKALGGVDVAVKVLKAYPGISEDYFSTLVNEASNLSALSKRPNVVEIYAVNVDKLVLKEIISGNTKLYERDPPRIIMEFMKGGTLSDLLQQDMFFYSSRWSLTVYKAMSTVADVLHYMHMSGFVHMDVKPQNVFLTESPRDPSDLENVNFKLGDLGSAVRSGGKITQFTLEYAPPESYIDLARPYLDVFSLGMTTYVLLTRKMDRPDTDEMNDAFECFKRNDTNCVREKVKKAQDKLRVWEPNVPDEVKPLLKRMIDPEPLSRPTSLEVCEGFKRLLKTKS